MAKQRVRQSRFIAASLIGVLALSAAWSAAAAVPVEESVPAARGAAPRGQASQPSAMQPSGPGQPVAPGQPYMSGEPQMAGPGEGDASRLTQLFYQLQVLQQEVQELRGQVEEQNHQLSRLARDQQEQYLDLDRRMQALRGGAAPGAATAPAGPAAAPGGTAAGGAAVAGPAPAGEREAYNAAFELMRQRQFEASTAAFNRFVSQYPSGAFTGNAYYWLGELHLVMEDNENARQSFAQVINVFPDHQKVPDALYKLGVVYHRLGDVGRAREFLNRVRNQHPQSSAAGLAQTYLSEL
jgi:tol-pal system protein YbgF